VQGESMTGHEGPGSPGYASPTLSDVSHAMNLASATIHPTATKAPRRSRRGQPKATESRRKIRRDNGWLGQVLTGTLPSQIAVEDDVDPKTVIAGVERALERMRAAILSGQVTDLLRRAC
jgi:hypothetical protein